MPALGTENSGHFGLPIAVLPENETEVALKQ